MKRSPLLYIFVVITFIIISGTSIKYVVSDGMVKSEDLQINVVRKGSNQKKFIALTFDDGPHPEYTPKILDLLSEYDIKATFFVLGQYASEYPQIIKRQAKEGHEIGNHTYSHINIKKVSNLIFKEEFEKTQDVIFSLTGVESNLFRPPYGIFNDKALKIINEDASNTVLWSFKQDSKDWSNPGVDSIVTSTISNIENGDIVLFHDYVYHETSDTVEALRIIVPKLIDKGYKFVTISELMNLSKY